MSNFHPTPSQIQQARQILTSLLPLELANHILHTAKYYTRTKQVGHHLPGTRILYARTPTLQGPVVQVNIQIESRDGTDSAMHFDRTGYRVEGIGSMESGLGASYYEDERAACRVYWPSCIRYVSLEVFCWDEA
ncbi:hypothetical protein OE88DRAFT_1668531 [Heliocybe sulcata]|uniref:Uncharacterized protein n=1 Tax=Heliocybe sulcata TaxID=5364 RepID=A0A5C3MKV4_9AGAM|nr:hypothetical protein OE88DRAFT_1668531 [Heliocybe sulcata]